MPDSTQVYRWIVGAAWHNVGVVESNKRHVTWTALTETNSFTFANCLSQFLLTVVWRIYLSTVLRHFLSVFSFLILITFIFDCVLIFWQEIRFQSLAVIVGERRGILSNIPYLLVFQILFWWDSHNCKIISPLQTSPDFFYTSVKTEFQLESLFDLLQFTDELEKLEG